MKKISFVCLKIYLCLLFVAEITPAKANDTYVFMPHWTVQTQFAGYIVARDKGFFKENNIDIKINYTNLTESAWDCLRKKKADFVTMDLSQALTARANGLKLVNIMQTSHINALYIVSHHPIQRGFHSLEGKEVGMWNMLGAGILSIISSKIQESPKWVSYNGGVNVFLSGAIDYCFVCSYNEILQIEECGYRLKKDCILKLDEYGINMPQEGVYVTEEFYKSHPDEVHRFVAACTKGWEWTRANKEDALEIVMQEVRRNHIGTNRYHQRRMLEEILRLQDYNANNPNRFKLTRKEFDYSVKLFHDAGFQLDKDIRYNDFVK